MFCLGCGESILDPRYRRSLSSPDAKDVAGLWKDLMDSEMEDPIVIGQILEGQDADRPPKMCRKCFSAYRTCAKQHLTIDANLRRATVALGLDTSSCISSHEPPRKRPRLSFSLPSESGNSSGITTTKSPDVAVNACSCILTREL